MYKRQVLNSANYVTGTGNGQLVNGSANISSSLANPHITWEKTDEFNYGLDLGFFKNRINLSIDAYYSVTRALLFEQPTQSFTGYSYYWNNIGKVRNSGVEIQIDTHNIKNRKFSWDTNINFSLSRNKLLELGGEQQVINQGERSECYIAKVGSPLIQFYGYKTNGVWNSVEEINANPHFSNDVPGGLRIVDTNNDGSLTPEDRVPLGNPYPDFTWGITNTFQIKNFDISFLIQGVQGIDVYNGDVYYNETVKWNKAYTKDRWVSAENPGNGKVDVYKRQFDARLEGGARYGGEEVESTCVQNMKRREDAVVWPVRLDKPDVYKRQRLSSSFLSGIRLFNAEARRFSTAGEKRCVTHLPHSFPDGKVMSIATSPISTFTCFK